jgi:hypothetical protein
MQTFRILVAMIVLYLPTGCATLKNTPQQDYVWEIGRPCEHVSAGLRIVRVEADGRYWISGTNNTSGGPFFECFAERARQLPYARWLEMHKADYEARR